MTLPAEILEGKYEVVRKINEGGMGAIYKVRHLLLEEERVIKVIRAQYAGNAALRERFTREARTAIRLRHPKIAEIFDFAVGVDGTAYIVMEYIEGKTLKDILHDSGPPAVDLTLEIAVQTLEGLGFLHRKGYLHRDVAPDNAMLTRDHDGRPLVKLIDLGIAKRLEGHEGPNLTSTGMFVGKARYSSPELFAQKEMDRRSDLYSFGVMLYELLTGAVPIEGTNLSQLIAGHLFKPPRDFSETDLENRIPADLRQVVMRSLAKEPDERMDSAEEYIKLLEPCLKKLGPTDPEQVEATIRIVRAPSGTSDAESSVGTTSISVARSLVGRNKFEEAEAQLRQALKLDPVNTEARRMLTMVEDVLRHKAEAERQGAITRLAHQIEELLQQGELDAAGEQLADAVTEFGEAELFRDLHQRLEEAMAAREQAERRRQQATSLLTKARRLADTEDLINARTLVLQALELDSESPDAQQLLANVEAAARRKAQEKARRQAIRRRAERIRAHLVQGELEAAESTLEATIREMGDAEVWYDLRGELEKRREGARIARDKAEVERREQEEQRIRSLLEVARGHQRKGEHEEAHAQVEVTLGIRPEHLEALRLRSEIEEQIREAKIAQAVEQIESCLGGEELGAATEILTTAETQLGPHDLFQVLRQRILKLEQKRRETQIRDLLASARQRYDSGEAQDALGNLHQARSLDPKNPEIASRIARLEEELEAKRTYSATVAELGFLLEKGKLARAEKALTKAEGSYSDTSELRKLRERLDTAGLVAEQAKTRKNKRFVVAIPAVLLVVAAVVVAFSRRPDPPTSSAGSPVIVNAVPWGRLIDIRDEDGNSQTVAAGGVYTPILLNLPPGKYTVRLANKNFKEEVEVEVEVGRDQQPVPVEFKDVSVEEFLHDLGW